MDSNDGAGLALGIGFVILYVALVAFGVYLYVRVARKAGYSGWYAALVFVPLVNIVVGIAFAFVEWPVEREVKALRARLGYGPGPALGGPGYGGPSVGGPGYGQFGYGGPQQQPLGGA